MKRRKFIALAAGGIGIVSFSGLMLFNRNSKEIAVEKIHADLHFLKLDKKGVTLFVNDYFSHRNFNYLFHIKIRLAYTLNLQAEDYQFWYYLTHDYLLSTDFFENKMDENRIVKYIAGMSNAFKRPCTNPFSHIYYPAPDQALTKKR